MTQPEHTQSPEFSETTLLAIDLATAAGEVHMRHWRTGTLEVDLKNAQDIVTQADREAEVMIRGQILEQRPDDGVLGEEDGVSGNADSRVRWIVDPLDGTSNFANGDPNFAVLIAVEEDGIVTSGVVHFPATRETYVAEKGRGAFRNGERLRGVRQESSIGSMYGNTHMSSKGEARSRTLAMYNRLMDIGQEPHVRNMHVLNACIARGLCDVADGINDFHARAGMNWWDFAAGKLLVEEAGGVATDWHGEPLGPSSKTALVASRQAHGPLLELLASLE